MPAARIAIAVGALHADAPRASARRADIIRAVGRFRRVLAAHEHRHLEQMTLLARGSRARLRRIGARIAALRKEPDSERKAALLAELGGLRAHYEQLSQYQPPER